ncbi:MAG: type II toxin-antitoxin system RelE/ParE family toxin [Candidatus Paracaedibacteraceae bacterium]|nr:type II toxin-antitoxin system RelE/ParE family toxin [Candidatus Paracaedibacteraceae bacterium]
MKWNVIVHPKAISEINDLPVDMRAKLTRVLELMQATSPFDITEPHIKSLGNKLMEIRLKGQSGISRVIYVLVTGRKIALLHAFIKKTQKTPQSAIDCALKRFMEVKND